MRMLGQYEHAHMSQRMIDCRVAISECLKCAGSGMMDISLAGQVFTVVCWCRSTSTNGRTLHQFPGLEGYTRPIPPRLHSLKEAAYHLRCDGIYYRLEPGEFGRLRWEIFSLKTIYPGYDAGVTVLPLICYGVIYCYSVVATQWRFRTGDIWAIIYHEAVCYGGPYRGTWASGPDWANPLTGWIVRRAALRRPALASPAPASPVVRQGTLFC